MIYLQAGNGRSLTCRHHNHPPPLPSRGQVRGSHPLSAPACSPAASSAPARRPATPPFAPLSQLRRYLSTYTCIAILSECVFINPSKVAGSSSGWEEEQPDPSSPYSPANSSIALSGAWISTTICLVSATYTCTYVPWYHLERDVLEWLSLPGSGSRRRGGTRLLPCPYPANTLLVPSPSVGFSSESCDITS